MRLALVTLLAVGCGSDYKLPTNDGGGNGSNTPPAPEHGKTVFLDVCSSCHGENGEGSSDGPQIQNPVRPYATYWTRNGRAIEMTEMGYVDAMPAHDAEMISDADLAAVLDFLSAAPHPVDGAGLYTRFCGNCHGISGYGGRSGKDIQHGADEARGTVRDGEGGNRYGEREDYMPRWSDAELSNAEVQKIIDYLESLPPNPNDDEDD